MLLLKNVSNQKNPPDELAHKKIPFGLVANTKYKHKKRVLPLEWDSETKQGKQKTKIC